MGFLIPHTLVADISAAWSGAYTFNSPPQSQIISMFPILHLQSQFNRPQNCPNFWFLLTKPLRNPQSRVPAPGIT
ncbi:hypothetical protein L1987_63077 [Smallanthus sonchifolius]|uniref:Uncharacterized protein n=1 Tax=Smallanthus sonchifolius TaxID=185202 RepID=A0ACB9CCG1_9ASTR|nr:hypothetical protein L1987_63077 [Smallanthus sonchifolius]